MHSRCICPTPLIWPDSGLEKNWGFLCQDQVKTQNQGVSKSIHSLSTDGSISDIAAKSLSKNKFRLESTAQEIGQSYQTNLELFGVHQYGLRSCPELTAHRQIM